MARHSATLALNERLQARHEAGEHVLHLGFGEAGLPVLPQIGDVLAEAAGRNSYGSVAGSRRVRQSAAGYFTRRGLPTEPDQIVVAPGSKALLFGLLSTIPGDLVLPQPSWVSYAAQASLVGKNVISVPIPHECGGVPDPDHLDEALSAAVTRGQRPGAMLLTLPDNPTATLASADLVRRCCAIAERYGLAVISDEIYRELRVAESFLSPGELLPDRAVITSGLSKSMALGGYRIGFARLPERSTAPQWHDDLAGVASEVWSSLAGPMQDVAAWVLDEPPEVTAHVSASRALHHAVTTAVHTVFVEAGASCRVPQGPFYLYPDLEALRPALAGEAIRTGSQLAELLLERYGVGVLAGVEFGDPDSALRFRVATSLLYGGDDEQRWEALHNPNPVALPWIRSSLNHLRASLHDLVERAPAATR